MLDPPPHSKALSQRDTATRMITNAVFIRKSSESGLRRRHAGSVQKRSHVRTGVGTSWCSHLPRITRNHWTVNKIALSLLEPVVQWVDLP